MGWILTGTAQQHGDAVMWRYAPDLMSDRVHVCLNRFYWVPQIVLGIALLAFGGWPALMWGVFLRVVLNLHSTWLVNSATHMWGSRRFETTDDSTNLWWVALLTCGEGWHNNHHAHPTAARHGLAWYEVDVNWYGIRTLQMLGLAKDIKLIKEAPARLRTEAEPLQTRGLKSRAATANGRGRAILSGAPAFPFPLRTTLECVHAHRRPPQICRLLSDVRHLPRRRSRSRSTSAGFCSTGVRSRCSSSASSSSPSSSPASSSTRPSSSARYDATSSTTPSSTPSRTS